MKKVVEGSVADVQGRILPNDQVIEVNNNLQSNDINLLFKVDGVPLSGYCNQVICIVFTFYFIVPSLALIVIIKEW